MADRFGTQGETLGTSAAMTARVLSDARRAWGDEANGPLLEHCARGAVADLWRDSIRVKTFVPVLALRQIRDMLDQRGEGPAERGAAR